MNTDLSQETVKELESLYASYLGLKKLERESGEDLSYGKVAIYEKMYGILKAPIIYGIVRPKCGDLFEDFIWHIDTDMPSVIAAIKEELKVN